jgi:hypothetical protein
MKLAGALAGLVLLAGCEVVVGPGVSVRPVATGTYSAFTQRGLLVVRDPASWETVLAELRPQRQPDAVNFSTEMVVLVLAGERPTSGYHVRVDRVRRRSSVLEVEAVEERPHPSCAALQVITQPFAAIAVNRTNREVVLTWAELVGPPC